MKSQMVVQQTGCIFEAAAQIRNDGPILQRTISYKKKIQNKLAFF
jgi:hypothetical protein